MKALDGVKIRSIEELDTFKIIDCTTSDGSPNSRVSRVDAGDCGLVRLIYAPFDTDAIDMDLVYPVTQERKNHWLFYILNFVDINMFVLINPLRSISSLQYILMLVVAIV